MESAGPSGPNGEAPPVDRRLAAVMFTDTVGFTGLGQRDEALMLRKAFDERPSRSIWANVEPRFDWLKGDDGIDSLVGSMEFP